MKRACCWVVVPLLLASLVGCIPLFYAYPSISYVPTVNIGPQHQNAYAFRVDVTDTLGEPEHERFRPISISNKGYITGQGGSAIDDGIYWNCLVFCYAKQTTHTMRLRIYRQGYELLDIHSWQVDSINWKEVTSLAAREKAIDNLLASTRDGHVMGPDGKPFAHLEPGSTSAEQRETLLFAAAEYEHLATKILADEEDGEKSCIRCRAKAKCLHELADK
jgi:hypothetical protein